MKNAGNRLCVRLNGIFKKQPKKGSTRKPVLPDVAKRDTYSDG